MWFASGLTCSYITKVTLHVCSAFHATSSYAFVLIPTWSSSTSLACHNILYAYINPRCLLKLIGQLKFYRLVKFFVIDISAKYLWNTLFVNCQNMYSSCAVCLCHNNTWNVQSNYSVSCIRFYYVYVSLLCSELAYRLEIRYAICYCNGESYNTHLHIE